MAAGYKKEATSLKSSKNLNSKLKIHCIKELDAGRAMANYAVGNCWRCPPPGGLGLNRDGPPARNSACQSTMALPQRKNLGYKPKTFHKAFP